jgi:predicted O-methyltransferase YrrM
VRVARFLMRYMISSLLVLLIYPFTNRDFFQQTYGRVRLFFSDVPSVELSDIFPELRESSLNLVLSKFSRRGGNVSYGEIQTLCVLTAYLNPKDVFEIGTYDGWTTLHLALNTPEDAKITTLDLKSEDAPKTLLRLEEQDLKYINKPTIGDHYRNTDAEYKINQVCGDSAIFDFSPFHNAIDFMFIDGSHHFQYVKSDSENALKMIRSDGVIAWHDFLVWPGVTDYILRLSKFLKIYHIKDTSLVIYRKEGQGD